MTAEPQLDLDDIQGHIIPGFGTRFQRFLYLRIEDLRATRQPLIAIANDRVTTARDALDQRERRRDAFRTTGERPDDPTVLVALALSPSGADRYLGQAASNGLSDEFIRMGMAEDAAALSDAVEDGAPVGWLFGNSPERIPDIVFILGSEQEPELERVREEILDMLGTNVTLLHEDRGEMLLLDPTQPAAEFEHFGFRDGISQPIPRGVDAAGTPIFHRKLPTDHPLAPTHADFGQPLVWPGQFLFGYAKQSATDPVTPSNIFADAGPTWLHNGSYLVVRRLRQDVEAFWNDMENHVAEFRANGVADLSAEALAAKLVGRWPNGTPLMRSPVAPEPVERRALNHFGYRTATPEVAEGEAGSDGMPSVDIDPRGARCPFAAHIRKVNPRDRHESSGNAAQVLLHLFLRRGIAFGPRIADDAEAERGLIFASYQTSVRNQFRFVQSRWANSTQNPGRGQDRIIGQGPPGDPAESSPIQVALGQEVQVAANPRWVQMTGGGYFLTPGRLGLVSLFAGAVG